MRRRPALRLSLQFADARHRGVVARAEVARWIRAALAQPAEITVRIVDRDEGLALNREYRGQDHATNVLTFPYATEPLLSADLVLCGPVVEDEATSMGVSLTAHYAHLLVHGTLHAQGFDHERAVEAKRMEARETGILAGLGYADPYLTMRQRRPQHRARDRSRLDREGGMRKISDAALKRAIVAVEAERLKHPVDLRVDRAQQALLQSGRRASEKMMSAFLRQAGMDVKELEAAHAKRTEALERIVAQQKADAVRLASGRKDTIHSSIVAQSTALRQLSALGDFFPLPSFSLDKPFLIWTTPLSELSEATVASFGSRAKLRFKTSKRRGMQKVGFYFAWTNTSSSYAVINATTFLSASGHLKAHAPWTFGVNTSEVEASALFGLWLGWPNNVTSTAYATESLGSARALGSTTTGGDTTGSSISAGVSLGKSMFAVPPGQVVVFEVALAIDYDNDDGDIDADFETGNFRIACPVVVVSLLNAQAGLMA